MVQILVAKEMENRPTAATHAKAQSRKRTVKQSTLSCDVSSKGMGY